MVVFEYEIVEVMVFEDVVIVWVNVQVVEMHNRNVVAVYDQVLITGQFLNTPAVVFYLLFMYKLVSRDISYRYNIYNIQDTIWPSLS